ncbi:MAG: THUMP-like domain-containing protein [Dysgonomonas sp.]
MDTLLSSFILEHENDDLKKLALQANLYPDIDLSLAIRQIKGRQVAREKIPAWYANQHIEYPLHLSLEQSSSEATAKFKASLFQGKSMLDLTGGMGVDFYFIGQNFDSATYIESQSELVGLAEKNFEVLNFPVQVCHADATAYLESVNFAELIYIDPARRDSGGKKTVRIEDCTPNVIEIERLLNEKAQVVAIKLSPMLDISLALQTLRHVSDIYIISLKNECKELLFIKRKDWILEPIFHCINILSETDVQVFDFMKSNENLQNCAYTASIDKYLYEPNASILKAGAYKSIAREFNLKKLHQNSHLYTSDVLHINFPGRKFLVKSDFSFNKNQLKENLRGVEKANITVRNYPLTAEELRKKLKLKDGGIHYIFASRVLGDRKILLLCEKK